MTKQIVAQVDELQEWRMICTPDKVTPPVDDSLDFDGILAEIEAMPDHGTAYGLIPWWWDVENERIGWEFCTMPFLW